MELIKSLEGTYTNKIKGAYMERLYTERQQTRYINILLILIFIAFVFCYIDAHGISDRMIMDMLFGFIIFSIAEIGVLYIWYPNEYKKKIAMEKGDVYTAKIKNIEFRHRTGIHLVRRSYVYVMQIECEINGTKKIWELGNYIDNPETYIPEDHKCKVYVYDGRYYVQDFYRKNIKNVEKTESDMEITDIIIGKYDNKPLNELLKYAIEEIPYLDKEQLREARDEREKFSAVRSKTYLIIPTMIFLGNGPYMWMYVEVHMNSKKNIVNRNLILLNK